MSLWCQGFMAMQIKCEIWQRGCLYCLAAGKICFLATSLQCELCQLLITTNYSRVLTELTLEANKEQLKAKYAREHSSDIT